MKIQKNTKRVLDFKKFQIAEIKSLHAIKGGTGSNSGTIDDEDDPINTGDSRNGRRRP
ncbi:hypothetical protein TPENAI_20237 [Tenacibaculum litopenaei]|uniref:hypothetical protein n=1 Tax=Tenacibaculum litopenaei TaxID=396016 RepID=UPI0038951A86